MQAYTSDAYQGAADLGRRLGVARLERRPDAGGDDAAASKEDIDDRRRRAEQGTMLWLDSMAIPRAATNVQLAHASSTSCSSRRWR